MLQRLATGSLPRQAARRSSSQMNILSRSVSLWPRFSLARLRSPDISTISAASLGVREATSWGNSRAPALSLTLTVVRFAAGVSRNLLTETAAVPQ